MDFSLTFALDFLDLTTFLPQILGKIYSSDFFYHILRQRLLVYTTAGTVSGRFLNWQLKDSAFSKARNKQNLNEAVENGFLSRLSGHPQS